MAARGLPLVIVNPSHVFGRGDLRPTSTGVVRRFLLRRIPAYVEGAINIVDVADVAAGHLLADERGVPGERYILGCRNYTWARLFAELERLSGIEGPRVRLPVNVALGLAEAAERAPGRTLISVRRGARGLVLVDLPERQGTAGARLDDAAARGHRGGDGAVLAGAARRALAGGSRSQPAPLKLAGLAGRVLRQVGDRLPG